ncbi:MAG: hypothetical protein ACJ76W_05070 [Chloroflexota bacterium]
MTTDTTKTTASSTGSPGGERMQEAASDLIDQAGRTAEAQASRTMTQAGDTIQRIAEVVRDAGSELRGERPEIANVADTAASQMERAGEYLRVHDATDVWNQATEIARRQPVLVVGGALLAGLALGRFLRTATETQSTRYASSTGGSWRSRMSSGMNASYPSADRYGVGASYGDSSYGDMTSPYDAEPASSRSTSFENRTSELEGTGADYATGGSSSRPSRTDSDAMSGSSPSASTSGGKSSGSRSSGSTRRGRSSTSTSARTTSSRES